MAESPSSSKRSRGRPRIHAARGDVHRARYMRLRAIGQNRFKFWLDAEGHARLRVSAEALGMTLSQFVAAAVSRKLKK